jgi:hypothetical protein
LPAKLRITTGFGPGAQPRIIPSLSRLVATPPGAKIYLVVTEPARGPDALGSPSLGDQLDIIAITDSGATTEGAGYPAADIADPLNLYAAGIRWPHGGPLPLAQRIADAYNVAVVPDGVAQVRWTFATRAGRAGSVVTVPVTNNVAVTKLTPTHRASLHTTWYAADGQVIPTSSAPRTHALAVKYTAKRRIALAGARRSHFTAAPAILHAFAVFDIDSRSGTRIGDGYVVSHPTLSQLPLGLLDGPGPRQQLDLRDVRKVAVPSGQTLYVVPGEDTICLFVADPVQLPYNRSPSGISGGCTDSLALVLKGGTGESSSGSDIHGSMVYAVVPRTTHGYKLQTGVHTFRIVHPVDGIVVAHTPFQFG